MADPEGRGSYRIDDAPGEIWYVSLAGSHLAKIDRTDGSVTVIEPPKIAAEPGFAYSLDAFIADPQDVVPDNEMGFFGVAGAAERRALLE